MANVTILEETLNDGQDTETVLDVRGHTVTRKLISAFGPATDLGQDAILVIGATAGDTTLAADLNTHMATPNFVPVMVLFSASPAATYETTSLASLLGLVANIQESSVVGIALGDDFRDSAPMNGYRAGQRFGAGFNTGGTVQHIPTTGTLYAGRALLEHGELPGLVCGTQADAGDARIPSVGGTFDTKIAWMPLSSEGATIGQTGSIILVMVAWLVGDYDALAFPVTEVSAVRFPAVDLSGLLTYDSSVVDWTQDLPANTSIVVEASLDGETWATVTKGSVIPGLIASQSLAGVSVHFRATLATSDGLLTPTFSALQVLVLGEEVGLLRPTGDYDRGQVLWTSGLNSGLAMEVKSWDDTTRTLLLFLPMPFTVAIGDTFQILPGCDKKRTTCVVLYDNIVNFQGFPDVPGQDQINEFPDAQRG